MISVIESHLTLLERQAEPEPGSTAVERAAVTADLVSLHGAVYEALERRLGADGLTEAHRPLVPLFRRWMHTARQLLAAARDLKAEGYRVGGIDDLVRAINRAKPAAEDFDRIVALNQRLSRGEAGTYRPLSEVMDELRHKAQPPG